MASVWTRTFYPREDGVAFDRVVFFLSPSGVEPGEYAMSVAVAGGPAASSPVRIQ